MAAGLERSEQSRLDLESARRDLFAAISHDLRTPLAAVRATVEALADGVVTDEPTRERYLTTAVKETNRLSLLIDDLFELAMIDSGELRLHIELLRLEDLVAEAVDAFRPQVEQKRIALAFERAQTSPVRADPQRLGRVLANLLQNALRHTPPDGTIVLSTAQVDGAVQVVVQDSGDGIPLEDRENIFERFYRTEKSRSREFGGSGLGLSIARGIVQAHGGRIWVEGDAAGGARVAFTIPAAGT
jgi:signal transduction histidine kinase